MHSFQPEERILAQKSERDSSKEQKDNREGHASAGADQFCSETMAGNRSCRDAKPNAG
jgi:hypothetical protein